MIGHLTKRIFTMMSPRIVLLFLGLVVALCQAAVQKPDTITYLTPVLTCNPGSGTDECNNNSWITGCTVKWFRGATQVHQGEDMEQTYTATRNDDHYNCKASNTNGDSVASADFVVNDLPELPTLTAKATKTPATAWNPANTCGAKNGKLTCATGGTKTKFMRVVKKGEIPAKNKGWVAVNTPAEKVFTPFVKADKATYFCEAAKTQNGAFIARSEPLPVACTDCKTSGSNLCDASDNTARNTCTLGDCVDPTATTVVPSVKPDTHPAAHTTGVSGGGGGVQTTGSKGSGTTSGASDLGRPASVLTIVCSLLTLTLNLRG